MSWVFWAPAGPVGAKKDRIHQQQLKEKEWEFQTISGQSDREEQRSREKRNPKAQKVRLERPAASGAEERREMFKLEFAKACTQ